MGDMHTGWYLIFTKSRNEATAELNLKRQGFEIYLPFIQQHKRHRNAYQVVNKSLFPRYVFVHLNSEADDWSKNSFNKRLCFISALCSLPARVPDTLIEQLKQEEKMRLMQPITETPNLKPGDKVQIIDGVLANYHGVVKLKNSEQRVTLLLEIAEKHTRCVNLSIHQVKLAENAS